MTNHVWDIDCSSPKLYQLIHEPKWTSVPHVKKSSEVVTEMLHSPDQNVFCEVSDPDPSPTNSYQFIHKFNFDGIPWRCFWDMILYDSHTVCIQQPVTYRLSHNVPLIPPTAQNGWKWFEFESVGAVNIWTSAGQHSVLHFHVTAKGKISLNCEERHIKTHNI